VILVSRQPEPHSAFAFNEDPAADERCVAPRQAAKVAEGAAHVNPAATPAPTGTLPA
jgi:hypothetical protein